MVFHQYEYEYVELIMMVDQMILNTFHISTYDVLFVYLLKKDSHHEYLSMIEEVFDFYLLMSMMQESGQS